MNKNEYHKLLNMRQSEERMFFALVRLFRDLHGLLPRDVINEYPINHKRAWYLLEKWSRQGKYEYGVSLDTGWIVED